MANISSRITTSSAHLAIRGGAAGKTASSVVAGNGNCAGAFGTDQITVVRIDDTHIAEEQSHVGEKVKTEATEYYEMEYSIPAEGEAAEEEEEDSVYVIEYSNPEEEGESYQFTMSVDRSVPAKKLKHPVLKGNSRTPLPVMSKLSTLPGHQVRQKSEPRSEEQVNEEPILSNKSVLELGEDYSTLMCSDKSMLVCSLCPPPGRIFRKGSGLAVHLKQVHQIEGKKTFFCTHCKKTVRTQIELDAHTRRHANNVAVFTCCLCSAEAQDKAETVQMGFKGSRCGLKKHLETEHPGVIPRCDICNRGFRTLTSYLADQFRHVGVSPYYCTKCQVYEMTERGLNVHFQHHNKKKKKQESGENHLPTAGGSTGADHSATDSTE